MAFGKALPKGCFTSKITSFTIEYKVKENEVRTVPIAKISAKGQVTIPAEIRKFLGVTPGTHLRFVIRGDTVQIEKGSGGIAALKGSVPVAGEQDFMAVRQHVMGEVASEIAGEGKDN
nr:AbrB/MazE/SpoVT family DNA-binding domain-containing protein [Moorella sulfitireducens]